MKILLLSFRKHILRFSSRVFLSGIFAFSLSGAFVSFALDTVSTDFPPGSATAPGSNNNQVWFSTGSASTGTTSYINKDNDSETVGNYLRGYYYDTEFGFFQLDWNEADTTQNVRIVSSTNKCTNGYGYKFAGYAESDTAGYIRFDYSNDIFVYYCESDKKLHGWAYSEHTGFQNFEGISFEIVALTQNTSTLSSGDDPFFVNNTSLILMNLPTASSSSTIQGKWLAKKAGQEIFFYIVK